MVSMETMAKPKSNSTTTKWFKMPNLLPKPKRKDSAIPRSNPVLAQTSQSVGDLRLARDDDDAEPTDELKSMPDFPSKDKEAATASDTRRRGISLEQSNLNPLFKRFGSTFRHGASDVSDSSQGSLSPEEASNGPGSSNGSNAPNNKTRVGACVATTFGTGIMLGVRPSDGLFVVAMAAPKCVAYLQEKEVVREIKSVVGERVKTRWGMATVEEYYIEEDMYNIALDWRWDDDHVWRMKATTKKFEKIPRTLMENTKHMLLEGYTSFQKSAAANFGYTKPTGNANSQGSTTNNAPAPRKASVASMYLRRGSQDKDLGRAHTPFGIGDIALVRNDEVFVVGMTCGATGYFPADAVRMLHHRTNFVEGDRVKTPYGMGVVRCYREIDEIYEISLVEAGTTATNGDEGVSGPLLFMSDVQAQTQLLPASSGNNNLERLSSLLNITRNTMFSASATLKARVSTMAPKNTPRPKYQKGERIVTKFGSGFILDSRPSERIYIVRLRRLHVVGYFREADLSPFPYERVTHFIVDGKTIPAPEMPRNISGQKRRDIISSAIRQAQSRDSK